MVCREPWDAQSGCYTVGCPGRPIGVERRVDVAAGELLTAEDMAQVPAVERVSLGPRWDRILGGGGVRGAILLVHGNPGAGKTTELLGMTAEVGGTYVSCEMDPSELRGYLERCATVHPRARFAFPRDVRDVAPRGEVVVLDSIQEARWGRRTVTGQDVYRETLELARRWARGRFVVLISQATKMRGAAGPNWIAHRVTGHVQVTRAKILVRKWRHGPAKSWPR